MTIVVVANTMMIGAPDDTFGYFQFCLPNALGKADIEFLTAVNVVEL